MAVDDPPDPHNVHTLTGDDDAAVAVRADVMVVGGKRAHSVHEELGDGEGDALDPIDTMNEGRTGALDWSIHRRHCCSVESGSQSTESVNALGRDR
jgi:hypothetical protein